jgi:peptide/nickel transport system ATP-binding protein
MVLQNKNCKILDIQHLSVTIHPAGKAKAFKVLNDVSFDIRQGEILAIVGESGGGKSMLAKTLMHLLPANISIENGHIWFEDKDLAVCSKNQMRGIRGQEIGMILQHPKAALNPTMTIERQIAEAIRVYEPKLNKKQIQNRVLELMQMVKIPDPEKCCRMYPHQFSGGMCQRVLIAIALAGQPKLLLADEPTSSLDVKVQSQILELLQEIQKKNQMAMILISHDLSIVRGIADRVAVMYQGSIVELDDAKNIYHAPAHEHTKTLLEAAQKVCVNGVYQKVSQRKLKNIEKSIERYMDKNADGTAEEIVEETVPAILQIKDLYHAYRIKHQRLQAVRNVSFEIKKGEIFGIVGASGSGKSTVAKCMMRIEKPERGVIDFEQIHLCDVKDVRAHRSYIEQNIQMIFQDSATSLNPKMKVRDIIAEPMKVQHMKPEDGWESAYKRLLNIVGLEASFLDRYPGELSGGQRQRVAIARAISVKPKLIIADEAVSALDISTQCQVMDLFLDLRERYGCSILFISHNLPAVRYMCDRVGVMKDGNLVRVMAAEEVTEDDI